MGLSQGNLVVCNEAALQAELFMSQSPHHTHHSGYFGQQGDKPTLLIIRFEMTEPVRMNFVRPTSSFVTPLRRPDQLLSLYNHPPNKYTSYLHLSPTEANNLHSQQKRFSLACPN